MKDIQENEVSPQNNIILVKDKLGNSHEWEINGSNAKRVLKEVMDIEKEKDEYDYETRRRILELSDGKVMSYEAFVKDSSVIGVDPYALKTYFCDRDNWIPERLLIHDELVARGFEKAVELSGRIGDSKPTIYILRGNTASGKTTALGQHTMFIAMLNEDGITDGVINPDTFKADLRRDVRYEGGEINHPQVHYEGLVIKDRLQEMVIKATGLSIVFDERFAWFQSIIELVESAEATDREIKVLDLDVPLITSLIRVLSRDPEGDDPVVPIDSIVRGFIDIRLGRNRLIDLVKTNDKIAYYLLAESSRYPLMLVAEKDEGVFEIHSGVYEELLRTGEDVWKELEGITISDSFIDHAIYILGENASTHARERVLRVLNTNKGKTLRQCFESLL